MLLGTGTEKCCRLCEIAGGSPEAKSIDRPWLSNDHHMTFVSVGALVPGWSLVAPKRHVLNLAEDYVDPFFWEFANKAAMLLEQHYGRCVAFEHGSQAQDSMTSCGTAHAHLHIVPAAYSLVEKAKEFDPSLVWERTFASEIADRAKGKEYLFVADRICGDQTEGHISLLEVGRSQFFRRVIAQELGRPDEFDYRTHPQLDTAEQSAKFLASVGLSVLDRAA